MASSDASSYTSKNAKRNEHIVGPDFLDAEKHPTIVFRSGEVTPNGAGYTSNGTLTALQVTVTGSATA